MHEAGAQRAACRRCRWPRNGRPRAAASARAIAWPSPCSRPASTSRRRRSSRRSPATWAAIARACGPNCGRRQARPGWKQGRPKRRPRRKAAPSNSTPATPTCGSIAASATPPCRPGRAPSPISIGRSASGRDDVEILVLRAAAWRNARNPAQALADAGRALADRAGPFGGPARARLCQPGARRQNPGQRRLQPRAAPRAAGFRRRPARRGRPARRTACACRPGSCRHANRARREAGGKR